MVASRWRGIRAVRRALIAWAATGLALSLLGLVACGTVEPVPTPTTDSPFRGAIVDCRNPALASETVELDAPVRACLVGAEASACLTRLTASARVDSIACVVRMQGVDANRRVLSGDLGGDATMIDNAARAWIRQEVIGYR